MTMGTALHKLAGLALGAIAALCAPQALAERLTVFAAASTGTALTEIAAQWEAQTGHQVALSLAGTSVLARQIERGAPADVFLAASPEWMDHLDAQGHIVSETRRDLLGNALVVVGPAGAAALDPVAPGAFAARLGNGKLAVALVDAVPGGIYAKAALETLGLWDIAAQRLAQSDNVRAALALVALGAAPLGIVYLSDARAEPRVSVVAPIPPDTHAPIRYPVAAISAGQVAKARAFLAYLHSAEARAVFEYQGFVLLEAD